MISYLRGRIAAAEGSTVVLDVNGVGFGIYMPARSVGKLPPVGEEIRLHIYMNVREDGISLFGFLTADELDIFKKVIGVSGIGPKGGLNILSCLSPDELCLAVMRNDVKSIAAAPGIGKKTAEKLILELKDRLDIEEILSREDEGYSVTPNAADGVVADAVSALAALGYAGPHAYRAVKSVRFTEGMTAEELLSEALKNISL